MKLISRTSKKLSAFLRGGKKNQVGFVFVILMAVIGTVMLFRSFAAAPEMYLTPASNSVAVNSNFTVTLRVNPGTNIDGVDATITYDATKLQYVSTDFAGSAFNTALTSTGGSGTVSIVRGALSGPISADSEVAKITFKGLAAGSAPLQLSGSAAFSGSTVNLTNTGASVNVTAPAPAQLTASYTIESSTQTPVANTQFGLKVYVDTNANIQGGEIKVNLPAGMTYSGTLDTAGTAFNPVTTVTGTTSQLVYLVFATQAQNLTGKQLVATIPVTSTTTGSKSITFSGARLIDTSDVELSSISTQLFSITVNSPIAKPVVTRPGKSQLSATEDITSMTQSFSITNFDSTVTYAVTIGGLTLSQTSGSFSIPNTLKNGNHTLTITATRGTSSDSASYQIRLRNANINRQGCVDLVDLLAVNKSYGNASAEHDLNFDDTVSLVDLLTVTSKWGTECVN